MIISGRGFMSCLSNEASAYAKAQSFRRFLKGGMPGESITSRRSVLCEILYNKLVNVSKSFP